MRVHKAKTRFWRFIDSYKVSKILTARTHCGKILTDNSRWSWYWDEADCKNCLKKDPRFKMLPIINW